MHCKSRFVLIVIVLATCAANLGSLVSAQEEKYRAPATADGKLAWKFKEGQEIKVRMSQNIQTSMEIVGQKMETTNETKNEMTLKIKSVDGDGVATASNVIDRMMINTSAPGASIKFDSSTEEEPTDAATQQMANIIKPMVGAEIIQKMKPNGEIFDVEIPKKMLSGVASANPMMAQMFNENAIKEMTSKSNLILPKDKLDVGEKWERKSEIAMGPATVENKISFEYLGVTEMDGKPHHVIAGVMEMKFPEGVQGMQVDVADEDTKILFYFDGVAGRLAKSELDQNMTMKFSGQQDFSQKMKQTLTMEFTEK